MTKGTVKAPWGASREAVLANLAAIRLRVESGVPLARIYRDLNLHLHLPRVTYGQFCRIVNRYAKRTSNAPVQDPGEDPGSSSRAQAPAAPVAPAGTSGSDAPPLPSPRSGPPAGRPAQSGSSASGREPLRADIRLEVPSPSDRLDPDPTVDAAKKRDRYV